MNKIAAKLGPFYGIGLLIAAALSTAACSNITHGLPKHLHSSQILFVKSGIGFLMAMLWFLKDKSILRTQSLRWQATKGFSGVIGNFFWISSLQFLPLADSSALSLTSAILTTAGAYYFFAEKPGRQALLAILIGFLGVLCVLKPSSSIFSLYSIYPLLSAVAFSASSLITKRTAITDKSMTTLVYLLLFMALFSLPFALYNWQGVSTHIMMKLAMIAFFYLVSQLALIEAYTYTKAAILAPFKFARFPLAIGSGILFFGETPDVYTLIGGVIIILSYVYLTRTIKRGD